MYVYIYIYIYIYTGARRVDRGLGAGRGPQRGFQGPQTVVYTQFAYKDFGYQDLFQGLGYLKTFF